VDAPSNKDAAVSARCRFANSMTEFYDEIGEYFPEFLRLKELLNTIENRAKNDNLNEVIIALSLNPQGEHTDMYLREQISSLQDKYKFKIVSLGRGLSTGTELEYSDSETIKNALKNRA
jgi:recombinational DNA repair protein RecR